MKNCKHNYTNKIMGWYKMSRTGEFLHCLSVPCPISPLLCIGTFCLFIFTCLPSSFFSPWFLGILFTFKYQVNNDLFFEGFSDPSGGLRNLFFQILISFNLESLFCLKNHCFSIFSHWNHQGNFNTLVLQPHLRNSDLSGSGVPRAL